MSSFQLNLSPLKEPLGFIKVLEWVSVAGILGEEAGSPWSGGAALLALAPKSPPSPGQDWIGGEAA